MLTAYLKRQWKLLLLLAGAVAVFAAVFALYSLPVEAVAYAGLLCLMLGLVLFALGYSAFLRRHRELEGLLRKVHESVLPLPPPRAGDAGAAGPLPGPTGGGVTQCDETVRNRAGL